MGEYSTEEFVVNTQNDIISSKQVEIFLLLIFLKQNIPI